MMSNFAEAIRSLAGTSTSAPVQATTWNGAPSLATPDETGEYAGRTSLFFKGVRGLSLENLLTYIDEAAAENIIDTFVIAFNLRDCRGGKGERDLGRAALKWLLHTHPDEFAKVVDLLPEYGRWDDLLVLFPNFDVYQKSILTDEQLEVYERNLEKATAIRNSIPRKIVDQLKADLALMNEGKSVSLCCKWVPTENDAFDRRYKLVKQICKAAKWNPKFYRKEVCSPLRSYIKIVEKFMCSKSWDSIDFSKVPSCAAKRLKKAFLKNAPVAYSNWVNTLVSGSPNVKVNATQLFPHELVHEMRQFFTYNRHGQPSGAELQAQIDVCSKQWEVLETKTRELGALSDSLVVVDTSSSMEAKISQTKMSCMDVSLALGLLISNSVRGPFHNHVITFSENPSFVVLKDDTFKNRVFALSSIAWGGTTNFQATFDLILDSAIKYKNDTGREMTMPKRLFVISDMQFNAADGVNTYYKKPPTNFEVIDEKYKRAGYERPQIVFWNVNGSSTDFPVSVHDNGTMLISGFTTSILKNIIESKEFSTISLVKTMINSERYKKVHECIKGCDSEDSGSSGSSSSS